LMRAETSGDLIVQHRRDDATFAELRGIDGVIALI
jgi:hypothetical protein